MILKQQTLFLLIVWGQRGNKKTKLPLVTGTLTRSSSDAETVQLAFAKLITNLDSLILKIYFKAAHAEPKSVQLADYQSVKKKKSHHLGKAITFSIANS